MINERGFYWIRIAGAWTISLFNPGGIGSRNDPPTEWIVMGFDLPVSVGMFELGPRIDPPESLVA